MAEEENNQNEETPEAEETPAEEPAPEQEAVPEQDAAIESEEQPSEDEDAGASDEAASAEEPAATSAPEPDAPGGEAEEPAEVLTPKQRRKRERSLHTGEAKPQRSAEERAQERAQVRSAKATGRRRRRGQERAKSGDSRPGTPPAERVEGTKKVQFGTVVSDKADKTITVRVDIVRRHRRYEKVVRQSATIHAHDERNEAAEGDVVRVIESRPLSRTKRWRLVEVVEKAPVRT
jgi:small subunit ribosomal protein S17